MNAIKKIIGILKNYGIKSFFRLLVIKIKRRQREIIGYSQADQDSLITIMNTLSNRKVKELVIMDLNGGEGRGKLGRMIAKILSVQNKAILFISSPKLKYYTEKNLPNVYNISSKSFRYNQSATIFDAFKDKFLFFNTNSNLNIERLNMFRSKGFALIYCVDSINFSISGKINGMMALMADRVLTDSQEAYNQLVELRTDAFLTVYNSVDENSLERTLSLIMNRQKYCYLGLYKDENI